MSRASGLDAAVRGFMAEVEKIADQGIGRASLARIGDLLAALAQRLELFSSGGDAGGRAERGACVVACATAAARTRAWRAATLGGPGEFPERWVRRR